MRRDHYDQALLAWLEQHHTLRLRSVRPLYRAVHPSRNLETLKGVGQDSAAVYARFIGDPRRFSSSSLFRGWSGMVSDSDQSAESEAKGLHLTQAGPDLIKKFAYLDAEIARHWDVQIAALYFDQMMRKGKHHKVVHGHRHKQNRAGLGLPDGRGLLLRILLCLIARQRCVREVSTEVVAI